MSYRDQAMGPRHGGTLQRRNGAVPKFIDPRRVGHPRQGMTARRRFEPRIIFSDLLPNLAETSNDFAWACCPFHSDEHPSFSVNLRTGWYRCFSSSCGRTGNNIVGFVSALLGLLPEDARRHLEVRYGR
ncbi:MAG: hypothetical protein KGO01_05645 [Burkholderiales bacterium]|nr:hypothetical protein [Burkholderiales bacterium]